MNVPQLPLQSGVVQPQISVASGADKSALMSAGTDLTTASFKSRHVSQSDIGTSPVDAAGSFTNSSGIEQRGVSEPSLSLAANPTFAREKPSLASSGGAPITASSAPSKSDSERAEDPKVKLAVQLVMALFKVSPPEMQQELADAFQRNCRLPEMSRCEINVPINPQEQSTDVKSNSESIQQHQLPGTNEMTLGNPPDATINQLDVTIDVIEQRLLEISAGKDSKPEDKHVIYTVSKQIRNLNQVIDTLPTASDKARLKERVSGLHISVMERLIGVSALSTIKKVESQLENSQRQNSPDNIHSLHSDLVEVQEFLELFPSNAVMNNVRREFDSLRIRISDIQKNA
ncbi:hypothetical protein [Endozoicomonas sp. ONNA2]|uniref:hypothetical protein n=1 Tax=Endozoicomonas sp. ONNA2 TaxID=2828741 RepID=UPI0021482628|nr:hypothetical protein [Endozoicomonas sp. ONNA2]